MQAQLNPNTPIAATLLLPLLASADDCFGESCVGSFANGSFTLLVDAVPRSHGN